jgi:single-strand DNA-binding protein
MTVNKVILVGNLGKDPEVRNLPSGEAVASVTLATSNKYKNRNGEMVDETEWHNITFFGRLAEIVGQYLKKGSSIYVEGRIKTEKYTDKNGIEKYATKIIAGEMKMLGSRSSGGSDTSFGGDSGGYDAPAHATPRRAAPARSAPPAAATATDAMPASNFDDMDDDIPF